jgi:glycosyltransferase involved in cell wall biosynthesis
MKKNVWFALDVRYPTEKAYGVTTNFTANAIQNLGGYDVTVITPKLDNSFTSSVKSIEIRMPFDKIRNFGLKENHLMSKLTFNAWKYLYPLKLFKVIKRKDNLIWLRDVRMSLIFCFFRYKVVCEIHREPSIISKFELKILNSMSNATIAVISNELKIKLKLRHKNSVIAPMSVNENELIHEVKNHNSEKFVVGYVGSIHSSGNKLSIDIILEAARYLEKIDPKIEFRLIGFSAEDVDRESGEFYPDNIKFFGRLTRTDLLRELDLFNVGLVIYPDTKYFFDSFPIKIVEYAARRIPILASNTRAHQRILGKDKALYFELNSSASLIKCISELATNEGTGEIISKNGFNWVKSLTYENRAQKILTVANF